MSLMSDTRAGAVSLAHRPIETRQTSEFAMPFCVGEVVCARYEIEGLLGVGSIGFVVSARRIDLGDKVALKFLRPESLANENLVLRFAREARVAASIRSEHVARVLDVGRSADGSPFIVMEKLEGRDLGHVLSEGGPLPVAVAIEYMCEVCEALAAAHSRGIVHRDIKPENLYLSELINGENIVKVLDFGISKVALANVFDAAPLARTSVIVGSPVYMSPEQIRESADVDARTDIWSIGCVLYELLAGSPAFDGQSLMQLCSVILERWPTPLTAHNPLVTPELEAVVWRCLAKDPAERYQNVADLAEALGQCSEQGAKLWVDRCKFLLSGVEPAPSSARGLAAPSSSRGSLLGPASSRRSIAPVALALPYAARQPRKFPKSAAVGFCGLVLAAAWLFRPVSAAAPPRSAAVAQQLARPAAPPSSAQPTVEPSEAPSLSVSAATVTLAPLHPARPSASASLAPKKNAVVLRPTAPAARIAERRPVLARAAKIPNQSARLDDAEPDVGY